MTKWKKGERMALCDMREFADKFCERYDLPKTDVKHKYLVRYAGYWKSGGTIYLHPQWAGFSTLLHELTHHYLHHKVSSRIHHGKKFYMKLEEFKANHRGGRI